MTENSEPRTLGVIEAFTVVVNQCPSASVRRCAEQALESVKQGGPKVLREQAYLVLSAMAGWRGDRAAQVHASLAKFLENAAPEPGE